VYKVRSFQQKLSIFNGNSTDLLIQISELNELRERLRKAERSAGTVRQSKRRKRTPIERAGRPWSGDSWPHNWSRQGSPSDDPVLLFNCRARS